jgi:hypothetical protein
MAQDLNATVKKVVLTDTNGKQHFLTGKNPEAQINTIRIYESIELNTIAAELQIIDTAINLIGSTPIVGTETVEIEMVAPNIDETTYKWKFVVYGIRNRLVSKNVQVYILDLFSPEALRNETLRIGKTISGTGDAIVSEILSDYLDTDKDIISEPCKYKMKQIPSLKRPFDVVTSMLPECVSSSATTPLAPQPSATSSKGGSTSASGGQTQAATKETATVVSGSAGYMFFETYDGYVFKSIDTLIKENQNKHPDYIYGFAQDESSDSKKNSYLILNYSFGSQENILKKMRYGVYSSMISFFNPSNLEYEEYFFDLSKEYPKMVHLGTDEDIPETIKTLAKYPSRVMLQFFDHETFHDADTIADPQKAGGSGGTQFPDFRKQWMAQSMSRNMILNNQILNITIPINFGIRAGDKLNVKLPNQSVSSKREEEKYDLVNSGLYLVKKISYDITRDSSKGLIAVCNLELIRDNLGS